MCIDSPEDGKALGFDNMMNRRIQGTTDWHRYEVVLVPRRINWLLRNLADPNCGIL